MEIVKKPWPRGRCEFWKSPRHMCGKKGRWMVNGEIRCGEHARLVQSGLQATESVRRGAMLSCCRATIDA